jgi:hypothetical protein
LIVIAQNALGWAYEPAVAVHYDLIYSAIFLANSEGLASLMLLIE